MCRKIIFVSMGIFLLVSCSPNIMVQKVAPLQEEKSSNPFVYKFNEPIRFADLEKGHITEATDLAINNAKNILRKIISVDDNKRTFANTMLPQDDLVEIIERVWSPAYLMGSTHTDKEIRDEADSSHVSFSKFINELSVNEDLYNATVAFSKTEEAKSLMGVEKKFLEETLRDFRRSGFGLSKDKREQVKDIRNRLADIGLEFSNNISSHQDTLFVTEEEIDGLPDDYKNGRLQQDGMYAIDMTYPSYFPFMRFAQSDDARKRLSFKFLNRARDDNLKVLDDMLQARRELVEVLGYSTFAEYRTEDRMAKNPETVWEFEWSLKSSLKEKALLDYDEMLKLKTEKTGKNASVIYSWEKRYYGNLLLKEKYQVDEEEVKQYFEISNVISGFFSVCEKLFGLEFREVENPSVWYEDVRMFEVFEKSDGSIIGRFYLDLFPRADKYGHAAAFGVTSGKQFPQGYQLPASALVTNFPKPTEDSPSLLPHNDVETFFHEFGHLLHGLLTKSELHSYAGTSVPRDFVEAPSQMLENWVWNKESLRMFAKHYETGEPIPEGLVDRMLAAKNLNSGTKALQQVFYGMFDFTLHDGFNPNGDKTPTDILIEIQNEVTLYPHQDDTHFHAAFGHLNGYAAGYYGYMWSLVFAQDMFSIFEENGIFDSETGMRYRKIILERGGTVEPLDMVKEFLGREPNNKAFLRSLGL